ncbi:hypothetical protein I317_02942 [Kwoniella heveanensis CBS 569]|nr:hypothetical protein I317_02942 [Kwoniella heveanensis CBS 569]
MKRYKDHEGLQAVMQKFGWNLARAEEETIKWYQEQEEKGQKESVVKTTLDSEEMVKDSARGQDQEEAADQLQQKAAQMGGSE